MQGGFIQFITFVKDAVAGLSYKLLMGMYHSLWSPISACPRQIFQLDCAVCVVEPTLDGKIPARDAFRLLCDNVQHHITFKGLLNNISKSVSLITGNSPILRTNVGLHTHQIFYEYLKQVLPHSLNNGHLTGDSKNTSWKARYNHH